MHAAAPGPAGWWLVADTANGHDGCVGNGDLTAQSWKVKTFAVCEAMCTDYPYLQYHVSAHCRCHSTCDLAKDPSQYSSHARVYERATGPASRGRPGMRARAVGGRCTSVSCT